MHDDGLHEIQLNGKQLVFLFMAATVVAVVIFLCGVMVGRGVPPPASAVHDTPQHDLDPTAPRVPVGAAVASHGNVPVTAAETLTYPERLEDRTPPPETLKPPEEARAGLFAPVPERATPPRAAETPTPPVPPPSAPPTTATPPDVASFAPSLATPPGATSSTPNEPAGSGFVVQVAAVTKRADADAMARRLTAKGYPAFVTTAGTNFRVRVGKYDDRLEAEAIAGRLEREEHFKPWITR